MENTQESIEFHEKAEESRLTEEKVAENGIPSMPPIKKVMSKNEEAKELMKSAQSLVHSADKEVNSVKALVTKSVAQFEEAKAEMMNTTMVHNMILLEKAQFSHRKEESEEPFEVSLETLSDHFSLAKITSGRFTGFLLAILGIVATIIVWVAIAGQKTGTEIAPDKVPDDTALQTLFSWIGGGMTGGVGNAQFGIITVIVTALLVGLAIYKFRVSMRETRNFRVAYDLYEKSHGYVETQKEAKTEIERIDEHLKAATALIADYKVALEELNAKLQRILHVERSQSDYDNYHYSSREVMEESETLMNRMENLLSTPVTKEGHLNQASENALRQAQAFYDGYISKLYNS